MIWVEWVELYVDSDPVYMRVSKETAIKAQRKCHAYESDDMAFDDFVTVHWATVSSGGAWAVVTP